MKGAWAWSSDGQSRRGDPAVQAGQADDGATDPSDRQDIIEGTAKGGKRLPPGPGW